MKHHSFFIYYILIMNMYIPLTWGHDRIITTNEQQSRVTQETPKRHRKTRQPNIHWFQKHTYNPNKPKARIIPKQCTTAIIIPCYHKHAPLLYPLIHAYTMQNRIAR